MRLPRRKRPGFAELIVASDLAFLLIIYFIVIAGFNVNMGFLVSLPDGDSARLVSREGLLRFEIDGEGRLLHGERRVGLPEARALIAEAQAANPLVAVALTVDPDARWQEVVSFVEIAHEKRIEAFSFAMRGEGER